MSHAHCRSPTAGNGASSRSCLRRISTNWLAMYSRLPGRLPSTMSPCSSGGRAQLPVQQGGSPSRRGRAATKPGGSSPAAFHARVFLKVDLDVGESGQGVLGCLQGMKCSLRRGRDVDIVEECIQSLTRAQLRMEVEEGGVLAERVKPGHQRISLFTPLPLQHFLSLALVIAEYVTAELAIKQAGEGQQACQLGVAAQAPSMLAREM